MHHFVTEMYMCAHFCHKMVHCGICATCHCCTYIFIICLLFAERCLPYPPGWLVSGPLGSEVHLWLVLAAHSSPLRTRLPGCGSSHQLCRVLLQRSCHRPPQSQPHQVESPADCIGFHLQQLTVAGSSDCHQCAVVHSVFFPGVSV